MPDAKSICNLGLGKIAASRVVQFDPPRSPVERHCAERYPTWRDNELEKRDWRFSIEGGYALTLSDTITNPYDGRAYKYALPNNCLRPMRTPNAEWEERGRFLFSSYSTLAIDYVRRVAETEFTSLFVDVLACRVAVDSVEFTTQSNTKAANVQAMYDKSVADAKRANAWIIGSTFVQESDEGSEWLTARISGP